MRQLQQNQQNPQNKSKKLINIIMMILAILIVFTACHKKKKPFLLLPLVDNSSVANTDNGSGDGGSGSGVVGSGDGGSGSGVGSSGDNGSGVGSSGDSGSSVGSSGDGSSGGIGGPTFTPAIGVVDTSFNSPNGSIIQHISSSDDYGYSLAIQSDGKILLGGSCGYEDNWDFCIARFDSNGTLDTSFGTDGKVIQDIGSNDDRGYSLAIRPNGKILLGGSCYNGSDYDFCIARFDSDGNLDLSFGSSGIVMQPIGSGHDYGQSLAIQPDGKILLGGSCYNGSNIDFCIARFDSDGNLDTTFNYPNGYKIQSIGSGNDEGFSLAIQPNGKILLGGYCQGVSNADFCIARFNSDGTLDTSFGTGGRVIQPIGSSIDYGYSSAIQPDGKILLGGFCDNGGRWDFCIARFEINGTLDTSFGTGGKVIQPIGSSHDYGQSLAIQPDGKILLGGSCYNGSNIDFCIARFNPDGTLDTSFGSSGKVIQPIDSSLDYGYSLAIQPNGKILLGGYCDNGSDLDFCIARFN
jgi:uncharacterized delta-60 repeat protein